MSGLRTPCVAGVAGGVGTTTLSTALHAHDLGRRMDCSVDVLVCRCTGDSLHHAALLVESLAAAGRPRPVLAVTNDASPQLGGPSRARLRMVEPQVAALVLVPHVPRWRELSDPLVEAAELLDRSPEELPKPLRGYVEALGRLADALVRSGQLYIGRQPTPVVQAPARVVPFPPPAYADARPLRASAVNGGPR